MRMLARSHRWQPARAAVRGKDGVHELAEPPNGHEVPVEPEGAHGRGIRFAGGAAAIVCIGPVELPARHFQAGAAALRCKRHSWSFPSPARLAARGRREPESMPFEPAARSFRAAGSYPPEPDPLPLAPRYPPPRPAAAGRWSASARRAAGRRGASLDGADANRRILSVRRCRLRPQHVEGASAAAAHRDSEERHREILAIVHRASGPRSFARGGAAPRFARAPPLSAFAP